MNSKSNLFLFLLTLLFVASCEKIPLATEVLEKVTDTNQSTTAPQEELPPVSAVPPVPQIPKITKPEKDLPQEVVPPVQEVEALTPEPPKFTEELLAAVQNWTRIPKSVFPAKPVTSTIAVNLVAKTSTGQVIGNSLSPAGTELQVLGVKGSTLIVANLNNTKLQGEVNIDETDFKQLLAYRFELNRRKKAEARDNPAKPAKSQIKVSPSKSAPRKAMDIIPDPLDFGHGRFCICRDCREKRLAKTGSLKTGFGIEP